MSLQSNCGLSNGCLIVLSFSFLPFLLYFAFSSSALIPLMVFTKHSSLRNTGQRERNFLAYPETNPSFFGQRKGMIPNLVSRNTPLVNMLHSNRWMLQGTAHSPARELQSQSSCKFDWAFKATFLFPPPGSSGNHSIFCPFLISHANNKWYLYEPFILNDPRTPGEMSETVKRRQRFHDWNDRYHL